MWVLTVWGDMKSLLARPLAVLPLAISLRISASRSDNTNSLATSLHISSISEGLTGALVRSIILCSRLVIGINKKASKQILSTASGSVATYASEGVISKINAIPLPITMPNRADTTDKVKAVAGEKNPFCMRIPKYIISDISISDEMHNAPIKETIYRSDVRIKAAKQAIPTSKLRNFLLLA